MYLRGNREVELAIEKLDEKFRKEIVILKDSNNRIDIEKFKILTKINENEFENTEYNQLMQVALNLKDVYRFSSLNLVIPENTLFHHYILSIMSILFCEYLNKELNENIDIYKILIKSLFHDFCDYKGNEILTHVKNYNEETKKMFSEMEVDDKKELESKIGYKLYDIILHYLDEQEGYISNLLDKMLAFMKLWIEEEYMGNKTCIKATFTLFQDRLKRFKNANVIENVKTREFLMDLLRESYIYVKEHMMKKDRNIFLKYFLEDEEKEFKEEIKNIRENKNSFLA